MTNMRKNNYIELLRFLFCIVIMLHHSGLFPGERMLFYLPNGGLAADFFFMITGYFAISHIEKRRESLMESKEPMRYTMGYAIDKLKRVLPYAAVGVVGVLAFKIRRMIIEQTSLQVALENTSSVPFELSFLSATGIINTTMDAFLNPPMWYLSAVLIALPLILYLAVKKGDLFKHYLVWILPPILMGYQMATFGALYGWGENAIFLKQGLIRGVSSLLMGGGIYYAAQAMKRKYGEKGKAFKICFTVLELVILAFCVYTMSLPMNQYFQALTVCLLAAMGTLCLSETTYTSHLPGDRFFGFLGKLSMPIYCTHWACMRFILEAIGGGSRAMKLAIYFALSFGVAVVLMLIFGFIRKKLQRR